MTDQYLNCILRLLRIGVHKPQLHPTGQELRFATRILTPHCPEQNGLVERVIRANKEQCVQRQRFEALQHASRVLGG